MVMLGGQKHALFFKGIDELLQQSKQHSLEMLLVQWLGDDTIEQIPKIFSLLK